MLEIMNCIELLTAKSHASHYGSGEKKKEPRKNIYLNVSHTKYATH